MKGKRIAVGVLCVAAGLFFFSCAQKAMRVEQDKNAQAPAPYEQERLRALGYASAAKKQYAAEPSSARGFAAPAALPFSRGGREPIAGSGRTAGLRAAEELWVIVRSPDLESGTVPSDEPPAYPALRAKPPGAEEEISLPLTHTDVQAAASPPHNGGRATSGAIAPTFGVRRLDAALG